MCYSKGSLSLAAIALALTSVVGADYVPVLYAVGGNATEEGLTAYTGQSITLDSTSPVLTLDYSAEVLGFPYIEVEAPGSEVQVALKFSEPYGGLSMPYGDGPYLFVDGLADGFRTVTFNFTTQDRIEAFVAQGGFRWQSIVLLSDGPLTITGVGLRPLVEIKDSSDLTGNFTASNSLFDQIWSLGARVVQAACYEAGTLAPTWQITDQGALIPGQFPAVSALGGGWSDYTLTFSTKITQGGTGWRVAGGIMGGYGPYFVLTASEADLGSDGALSLERNSLVAGYGFSFVNQILLSSATPTTFPVDMPIHVGEWHTITTAINSTGYLVSIDGTEVAFVESSGYQGYVNGGWGSNSLTSGTFGFGPWLNQEAYVTNVTVTGSDGTMLYENDMTSNDTLGEYSIDTNSYNVCLDGAKRDRSVWIGDFVHTARILATSTGGYDMVKGMIEFEFANQVSEGDGDGIVPISAYAGSKPEYRNNGAVWPGALGEADYQFLFLLVLGDYFAQTSDVDGLKAHWSEIDRLVTKTIGRWLDPVSGLLANSEASWFLAQGQQNATAPTALLAASFTKLSQVAMVIGDTDKATTYASYASNFSTAINSQLWSDSLGTYSNSLSDASTGSLNAISFTIIAGIADADKATKSIQSLDNFLVIIGYKDLTSQASSSSTQLSPNTQGFLLDALFLAHINLGVSADIVLPAIDTMLNKFWSGMVNQNEYYTGTSWEYMLADGSPWAFPFDSLGHPWGGAPTYVLSNYILGVRSEWNETTSSFQWVFDPAWEIAEGLNLTQASGRMPLSSGGYIEASWSLPNTMSSQVVDNDQVQVLTRPRS
ncbi:Six-hairpin glycosidase [Xylariaceae sp. FL1272]|nr:Six-hairpin glycosidase [Xylariaceae sp. FL1272]